MKKLNGISKLILVISLVVILISGTSNYNNYLYVQDINNVRLSSHIEFIDIEQFNTFLEEKELTAIHYDVEKDIISGSLLETAQIKYGITSSGFVYLGNVTKLVEDGKLSNESILDKIETSTNNYKGKPKNNFITTTTMTIIMAILCILMFNRKGRGAETKSMQITTSNIKKETDVESIKGVKMNDVKGHDEIRADLEFLIKFLKNPEKYEKLGAKVPKGVLLFGPPGTGKTMIAKAIANEAGIPFIATGGSDFVEKYVGVGAQRVRDVFKEAKNHPKAIIYIDEIDAVGKKRGGDNDNDERTGTLNALLMEMDGFKDSENILVIASTNRIDILDDALLRPGRFDKHISVNPPDYKGRLDILKLYAKNKKLDKDVRLDKIATVTRGFSGAELANLLNEAAMLTAFREKSKTTMLEVDDAFYKIVTKGDKKSSFDRSIEDTLLTAWHEAGHAIVSKMLANQKVNKVTIIPSTSGAGGITLMEPKEGNYYSKEDLENMVKVSYGGRAAEYLLLKDEKKVTTGASNDIEKATNIIMSMLGSYGMSEKFGLLNLEKMRGLNQEYVLTEAKEISNKLYRETIDFLKENYDLLKEMSEFLVQKETIEEEDVDALILKYTNPEEIPTIIIPDFNDNTEEEEKKKNVFTKLIPDKLLPEKLKSDKIIENEELK